MLDLVVDPGNSLKTEKWEFALGMHFSQAVAVIQHLIGTIKGVQVLYSESAPLGTDLILNLSNDGIQLYFDPICQKLKIIEVYNMKAVKLKYCDKYFNSLEVRPTIEKIDDVFGATHPGVYDSERQMLTIDFRGVSFSFPVDPKSQVGLKFISHLILDGNNLIFPNLSKGLGSLCFPSSQSPTVSKMLIYFGSDPNDIKPPSMPLTCMHNLTYLESLQVIRKDNKTKGVRLHLYTDDGHSRNVDWKQTFIKELLFGATCQEVAGGLGAPNKVFYKSEDKMKIHNAHARKAITRSDYFFNYFTLGLDILFDAKTQRAKKFVLHTNFPGHYNFNMYHRCNFELPITLPRHPGDTSQLIDLPVDITVQSVTLWNTLGSRIKPRGRPIVLHRSSSTNTSNPFGSTFCHAYQDIIFEVMANGHIASVTLYESEEAA